MYIWQNKEWPNFRWNESIVANKLSQVKFEQGRLLGIMSMLGFDLKNVTILDAMTSDIVESSNIEGITLNTEDVRSSIAWQLGLDNIGSPTSNSYIEGVVEVMFDAVNNYQKPLTQKRLFSWHTSLFPNANTSKHITVGGWRESALPMQVVSGRHGNETVHYEAPSSNDVPNLMNTFLNWVQKEQDIDMIVKAAIAHLWFVTIHPFSDGNGRIARTIMDMLLAKSDDTQHRFIACQILLEKKGKSIITY